MPVSSAVGRWVGYSVAGTLATVLSLAGCRDPRRTPSAVAAASGSVAIDHHDAAAVGRAFLEACLVLRDIGQRGMRAGQDQAAYGEAEARIMALADREGVARRWGGPATWGRDLSPASREHRIDKVVKNWPSIVARYVPSMRRDAQQQIVAARQNVASDAKNGRAVKILVEADEPDARERRDHIRREVESTKNVRGEPLRPGSEEFETLVRRKAAQSGISPTPGAEIVLALGETAGGWRVSGVEVAPLPTALAAKPPNSPVPRSPTGARAAATAAASGGGMRP